MYRGNLYAKLASTGLIQGWNISFAAENSERVSGILSAVDGDPAINGAYLGGYKPSARIDEFEGVILLYQTRGDDITLYTGNAYTGEWTKTTVPIPDD